MLGKGLVVFIHGCGQAFSEQAEDGLIHPGYRLADDLPFLSSEITEHIINNISLPGFHWSPDAYPDPDKVLAAQFIDYRVYPFLSPGTASPAQAHFTQWQVKVIVNDDNVIKGNMKLFCQPTDRTATQIHVGLGSGQYHLVTSYLAGANSGQTLLSGKSDTLLFGQVPKAVKAHIVPVMGKGSSRVT